MAILILYSVIFVPVRVGFAWRSCIFAPDWIWDLFVDGCFVMDILITFRTAIFIDGGEKNQQFVITDPKSIAVRYAKSWLIIDVSSTIPVNVIVDLVMYASSSAEDAAVMRTCAYLDAPSSNTDVSSSLKSVQSLRVIRVVRLLKLFRFLKLGQLLRRWEDQANLNPAIFRLTRLFVVILFLSHLIACMWFGVFKLVIPEGEERTRSNWVAAYAANQMTDAASERVLTDSLTQYLSAMYWAFTTMTTVGYGDILPQNLLEMWFVILMEFVGLIVFGMAIASMTNILANFNLQKKLLRERMAVVNRYVRERDLTQRMQRRVRRFYEYYLERVSVFEVATMLDEVSQSLKNDLCEVIFREMANDLPALLAGRDASFVALVGMQLQPFFSLPGEYICRRGVIGLEVYWIRKGRVQLKWGERSTQVGFLGDGDHFGQEVLHSRDLKMISDVRAVLYCDLLYIPKQALEELNNTYPTLIEELKRGSGAHSQPEQPPPERPTQLHLPASMDSAPPSTWQDHKEEERLERLELSRRGIVHPNSPFRSVWDMGLAMLVIYSIVVVPLRIGFEIESASDSAIFWFEVSIDFTFIIDIVINCRTAYITSDGALESRPRRILRHYALSWFAVDFISSIPIDLILLAVGDVGGDSRNSLRLTKLIKSLRLVRLLKLLRLLKITKYLKTAQEELQVNPLVLELVGLAIKTLFLMHLAACVWHWSALLMLPDLWELRASCNATSCVFDARADAALNTWLQYFADSHFAEGVWPSVVETYTASMYWALTTMSTIGYGDIKSITNLERVVSIIIMLVGSVIFGIVVGGMTNVLEQINSVRARATEKKDYVKAMLRERAIPQVLITRTKQYYNHYLLECADVATEQKILSELCPPLRTEVLLFLNARTVESIHFFHGQDSTFIVSVCKMLKPCFFAPQDWIFREGELGLEMYFMQLGSVEVVCYLNAQEVVLDTLESGAYFGEVAIMIDGVRREASVRAVSFCSMFSFSKESLNYLLQMYPDVMRTMQSQMEQRLRRWRLKRTINTVKCHNRIANAFKLAGRPTPGCASGSDGAGAREERSSAVSDGADAEADSGRRSSHSAREGEAAAGRPTPPRPSKGESKGEPKEAAPAGTPAPAAESDRRDSTPSMRRQKSMLPGSCSFARRSSITPSKSRASSGGADDEAPKSPVIAALNNSNSIEHSLEKLEQARHRGVGLCSAAAAADALGASSPKASHLTPADEPPPSHSAADDGGGAAPSQSRLSELKVEDPDVDGSLDPARASQLWSENAHGKVTFQGGRRMSVEHGGQKLRID